MVALSVTVLPTSDGPYSSVTIGLEILLEIKTKHKCVSDLSINGGVRHTSVLGFDFQKKFQTYGQLHRQGVRNDRLLLVL